MKKEDILKTVDHTLLTQTATWEEIKSICDDAITYHTASVCIPPSYVRQAKEYVGDKLAICTVIGFPNGYNTMAAKVFEAEDAIKNGADELDMVINIGLLKSGDIAGVEAEICALKAVVKDKILKVIIETCLLTEAEKIMMCKAVTKAKADFIKTSTGFSSAGATREDIALFAANVGMDIAIKAAGGISSFKDGEDFINLGASRLGTSRLVKLEKAEAVGTDIY